MGNALDYIKWRGDISLIKDPLNEVDMLLFAMMSTPTFSEILKPETEMRLEEVAEKYFKLHPGEKRTDLGLLQSEMVLPTLQEMAVSTRFKNMILSGSKKRVNVRKMEQFEAITILPEDNLIVLSYRGTDVTLVGWKENCYLAINNQVAAQKDALRYLMMMAQSYPDANIITLGHSKGGNLAVYAAVNAPQEIQDRILLVYGFDSPGFMDSFFLTEGYERMKDRIVTLLTQYSIVGVIMKPAGRYQLIHANVSGPLAHDCYNWEVMRNEFVKEEEMSDFSLAFSDALNETLNSLTKSQMIRFIDELFDILQENGAVTVTDLTKLGGFKSIIQLAKLVTNPAIAKFFLSLIKKTDISEKHLLSIRKEAGKRYKSIRN